MKIVVFLLSIMFLLSACNKQAPQGIEALEKGSQLPSEKIDFKQLNQEFLRGFEILDTLFSDSMKMRLKNLDEAKLYINSGFCVPKIENSGFWDKVILDDVLMESGIEDIGWIRGLVIDCYYDHLNKIDIGPRMLRKIGTYESFPFPSQDRYPEGVEYLEYWGGAGLGSYEDGYPIITHLGKDTVTNEYWEHTTRKGWRKLSKEEYNRKHRFGPPVIGEETEAEELL